MSSDNLIRLRLGGTHSKCSPSKVSAIENQCIGFSKSLRFPLIRTVVSLGHTYVLFLKIRFRANGLRSRENGLIIRANGIRSRENGLISRANETRSRENGLITRANEIRSRENELIIHANGLRSRKNG